MRCVRSHTLARTVAAAQLRPHRPAVRSIKMDIKYAEQYGETLFDYAFDMLFKRETRGVNHAEFIFVRLSELIKEYEKLKPWFLKNVRSTLEGKWLDLATEIKRPQGYVPEELIEYIAHVMKWSEFEEIALFELEKHKGDEIYLINRNLPSSILKALDSNWEDREFYKSLGGG